MNTSPKYPSRTSLRMVLLAASRRTREGWAARPTGTETETPRCDIGAFEFTPSPKEVDLKASRSKVREGRRVTLTATVTPCVGHEGDIVRFLRGTRVLAEKASDPGCVATHKPKLRRTSTFHAVSPQQDADHTAGTSDEVKVKVKRAR